MVVVRGLYPNPWMRLRSFGMAQKPKTKAPPSHTEGRAPATTYSQVKSRDGTMRLDSSDARDASGAKAWATHHIECMGGRTNPVIKSTRLYLFLAVFVLPYVLLILPGIPRWLGRTVAVMLFVVLLSVCIFWFGVSPKSKIIRASGKLSQPQYDKVRPKIELGIRVATVFLGVLFCFTATFPLALDLAHLAVGRKPTLFIGTVVDRSTPFMDVLLLAGSVRLSRVGPSYYLLYSRAQPHLGESYEFLVLPRSRFIVDFRSLPAATR